MSDRSNSVPSYRRHRQSGKAIVTLTNGIGGRRDVLLGKHGTKASRVEYARVIAEWEARGRTLPADAAGLDLTVAEVLNAFRKHAEHHYRHADGTPTSEVADYGYSLRPVRELYGATRAAAFGPLALEAVRQRMIASGWSRGVINQRVGRIKRAFKWAASKEMVPATVIVALQTVTGLAKGRSDARETAPIRPVPEQFVDAVQPHVLPEVWAMIELQRLTGMRPGEVCMMQPCDLDTTGPVWTYRPSRHKTAWRGKERIIPLGPRAQMIVREFLPMDTQAAVFSPRRAMEARRDRRRAARKTPVQPSQADRRKRKPERTPQEQYTSEAYAVAIARGCLKAGVPHWHPNQLRHNYATDVRRRFGLEAAGASLGHAKMSATEVYAERDQGLARKVAAEIG